MKTTTSLALSALFLNSLVAAAPSFRHAHHAHLHQKRELVRVTEVVETTVYSTKTVWVDPATIPVSAAAAPSSVGGLFYEHHSSKQEAAPYTPPYTPPVAAPSPSPSSSSVYVAPAPTSVYTPPPAPTSTSVYVAPTPTSVYVAPTSVYVAPSSAYVAPAASPSAASSNGAGAYGVSPGEKLTGDTTYYNPGGNTGACGPNIAESDHVVAISQDWFDQYTPLNYGTPNPNMNPMCGQAIKITNTVSGQTFDAKILDRCTGCKGHDIDLPSLFFDLVFPGKASSGRISGTSVFTWTMA